jgi:putative phosphoesterase
MVFRAIVVREVDRVCKLNHDVVASNFIEVNVPRVIGANGIVRLADSEQSLFEFPRHPQTLKERNLTTTLILAAGTPAKQRGCVRTVILGRSPLYCLSGLQRFHMQSASISSNFADHIPVLVLQFLLGGWGNMRILVVADIHGNRAALESIREQFDVCICVGDLVDYGPEPGPCIDWVRKYATYCVRGNHDHGVAQGVQVQGVAGFRYLTAATRPLSIAALASHQRRYLAELPTSQMFTLNGKRFLLVHATPRDPMDEYAPADVNFWAPRIAKLHVDYVIAGHTHQPYTLQVNGTLVINPGSVGLCRDGNPQAGYAVIDDNEVQLKRVAYPLEETIAAVEELIPDQPARLMLADIYRYGAYLKKWMNHNGNGMSNGIVTTENNNGSNLTTGS